MKKAEEREGENAKIKKKAGRPFLFGFFFFVFFSMSLKCTIHLDGICAVEFERVQACCCILDLSVDVSCLGAEVEVCVRACVCKCVCVYAASRGFFFPETRGGE